MTLTEGRWLADAPCTQALWEAVMGSNPSYFVSPERPVEQVSWDDCQEFVQKLNERVAGLEARLPSEAEWEQACRAGTQTATWLGDLEILGECNAPLLDEIAWYGGTSGQEDERKSGGRGGHADPHQSGAPGDQRRGARGARGGGRGGGRAGAGVGGAGAGGAPGRESTTATNCRAKSSKFSPSCAS